MSLAIFDLDFTVLEGDSEWLWSEFLRSQRLIDDTFTARMNSFYRQYEDRTLDFDAYERFLIAPQTKLSPQYFEDLCETFLQEIITNRFRPFVLNRIQWHRARGDTLLLVTACNETLSKPIADLLQFSHLICTRICNGRPIGIPAFRDGKVALLQSWLKEQGESLSDSWGYSDSFNDLPLLQLVDHPVAVTPDENLLAHAISTGWEIIPGQH